MKQTIKQSQNALMKLYELCATLNCWNVITVNKQEHIEELNNKVPRPTDDQILTVRSLSFDRFLSKLKEQLVSLLEYIGSRGLPPIDVDTDEQRLVIEKQNAETAKNFTNVILIKYMIMFVKRFNALADLPLKSVFIDILQKLDLFYNKKETPMKVESEVYHHCVEVINSFTEQFKSSEFYLTNPKLDFLSNVLREQIEKRDSNTRGLVLVSRTLYAKLIFDYFKETENVIKPCWLVGQTGVDYQNTLPEQDKTLKDFRKGLSNAMFATDIVQEGLDVPECSFVIRYEFVSNEIGTVQSKGRARAEKSSCYLIVGEDSDNLTKEMTNRYKVMEMENALQSWSEKSVSELRTNIENVQNRIIAEWQSAAKLEELRRANLKDPSKINGKISCRSCDYYLGELAWIRKKQHSFFVPQRQLNPQIEVELFPMPNIYREIQVNGKVRCGNKQCREDLGGVQQLADRPDLKEICVLKCKQLKFSVERNNGENDISIYKKWSDVTFNFAEVEPFS